MRSPEHWGSEVKRIDPPLKAVVMSDWVFVNPFSEQGMTYTKGEKVELELMVPAQKNDPFGFPFYWGSNGKPYAAWIIEEDPDA